MIAIVDYGMGNLRSVQKGFERVGYAANISNLPEDIDRADHIVLPGVGAFGDAVFNLGERGLLDPIQKGISDGKPFLGICLGLQLLFTESDEMGSHNGLNYLPGRVRRLPGGERIPQIGWNQIQIRKEVPLLEGVPEDSFFYFVHSYFVDPADAGDCVAVTDYGIRYASVAGRGKAFGVQFHPEKSQDLGLKILQNFARL